MKLCILDPGCPERKGPEGDPDTVVAKLRAEPLGLLTPCGHNPTARMQACWVAFMSPFPILDLGHLMPA